MKKCICFMLVLVMLSGVIFTANAEGKVLNPTSADYKAESLKFSSTGAYFNQGDFFGFKNVDLTGIKSVTIEADCILAYGSNGEAVAIKKGGKQGELLGYVVINDDEAKLFTADIKETKGIADLYFCATYAKDNYITIKKITLNTFSDNTVRVSPVPDSAIVDNFSDTWAATDSLGRRVADYSETGGVKEGDRFVGIMYWDWHTNPSGTPVVISKVIKENPDSQYNYSHPAWANTICYWDEPLLGFYQSYDYFVYRRHAQWLANAGVDVIFYDYTNLDMTYIKAQRMMMKAFHDAREDGINAPKISAYLFNPKEEVKTIKALWFNLINDPSYKDLVFYWEGKPLICGCGYEEVEQYVNKSDSEEVRLLAEIFANVNFRRNGSREHGQDLSKATPQWNWLENYPLHHWGKKRDDGRVEAMVVGASINHSYVYGYSGVGLASDPYTKGRGYSEAFGEDYTLNNARSATFFREQAAQALDTDPAFIYVDGWNEYTAIRNRVYNGFVNSFVDTYDDENSRDFEPSKGVLGDDYYNLLVDFCRKYKGVRPAPLASADKTIDLAGELSQWESVIPLFINDRSDYERNAKSQGSGEYTYISKPVNVMMESKVSKDSEYLYFYVETLADIIENTEEFMHLYINSDRNYATGWEGYDYAFGRSKGVLEKWENGAWIKLSDAEYTVSGNALQAKIKRSDLSLTGTVDMEFKWVDSAGEIKSGNLLDLYVYGNSAPMGRFNYVYTEIEQKALDNETRKALKDTVILKPGSRKFIVDGGIQYVYEPDIRIAPIEENGTLYVPSDVLLEAMYGESKVEYDAIENIVRVKAFYLKDREIKDYKFTYTTPGSFEVKINGAPAKLTSPVKITEGRVWLPVTYFADCFGYTVSVKDGYYVLSRFGNANEAAVNNAIGYLK
ncbi:MAG: stalk domain-containing protein [Clostridia bacterium]|nr:stalk domain-containing protein [Clostridia bacterium]